MQTMTSRQRLLRTIAGEQVDRVPFLSLLPWNPLSIEFPADDWKSAPNFRALVPLVREHCDFLVHVNIPECAPPVDGDQLQDIYWRISHEGIFDRRFLLAPPEAVQARHERQTDGTRLLHYTVRTPQGDLTSTAARYPGDDTLWDIEPLVKEPADARRLLSVPYRFDPPDLAGVRQAIGRLGERGLATHFVSTPLVMVSHLTGVQTFLEWTISEPALVEELIETAYARVEERLRYILAQECAPLIHFGGNEQATPPLMSRRMFDRLALAYDRRLWEMVRAAGRVLWIHCHGRIAGVLDAFIEGGVQMLDPVEPPPMGDIDFATAWQRVRGRGMTLVGNLQWSELVAAAPDQVERMVAQAIAAGGKDHKMLYASAMPHATISDAQRVVLEQYVAAGLKYGAF